MNPTPERLRLDLLLARYLEAVETDDFETQDDLWKQAESDPGLCESLEQIHEDLLVESGLEELGQLRGVIRRMVEEHLPAARIEAESPTPVRIADVAEELFRHPPERLAAAAHAFNESLRHRQESLPDDLGLSALTRWAEERLGPAPPEYWKAFREVALRLELRHAAQVEFQLAARSIRKPGGTA